MWKFFVNVDFQKNIVLALNCNGYKNVSEPKVYTMLLSTFCMEFTTKLATIFFRYTGVVYEKKDNADISLISLYHAHILPTYEIGVIKTRSKVPRYNIHSHNLLL